MKSKQQINIALQQLLRRYQERLSACARHPVLANPMALLLGPTARVDELKERIDFAMQRKVALLNERLSFKKQEAL